MHFEFLSSLNIGLRVIDLSFEEVGILFKPKTNFKRNEYKKLIKMFFIMQLMSLQIESDRHFKLHLPIRKLIP